MDIQRPDQSKKKRKKRIIVAVSIAVVLTAISIGLARLKPAAPTVEKNLVWIDVVKRGQMLRQVRGLGTLVPEEIRWIAARTQGRVDKIILRPGAPVTPDSVILLLANPDVEQAAASADSQLKAAEADLVGTRAQLESGVLAAEAAAASARADYEQSKLKAEVNDQLYKDGLVSELDLRLLKVTAEQLATRNTIEQKRYAFAKDSIAPQLSVKEAEVERLRGVAKLRHDELDALTARAGMNGVLQLLPVDVGSQIQPGVNLARVADPARLKAEIRVAETQAKDITIGQVAEVDTRNGIVSGHVSRIDPSVQNGTVTVDVLIDGPLPKGSRPVSRLTAPSSSSASTTSCTSAAPHSARSATASASSSSTPTAPTPPASRSSSAAVPSTPSRSSAASSPATASFFPTCRSGCQRSRPPQLTSPVTFHPRRVFAVSTHH